MVSTLDTSRVVLHIDDDPLTTQLIGKALAAHGIESASISHSEQAIKRLLAGQHRVVILDIETPGMDSLEMLRRIKDFDGGIQVIMLTELVNISTVVQSIAMGAEAWFFKPLEDVGTLVEAIESAFSRTDRWWKTLRTLASRRREIPSFSVSAGQS